MIKYWGIGELMMTETKDIKNKRLTETVTGAG